jgi:purine-binding chemotaxis protein CheW
MAKDDQQVMKIRAERISGEKDEIISYSDPSEVVVFLLGGEKYAVETSYVKEVLSLGSLTTLPRTPEFVAGLMNVRGKIISVVDLKKLIAPDENSESMQTKIIYLLYERMELGILVDQIAGTHHLDKHSLGKYQVTGRGTDTNYYHGVTPEGIVLLNAGSILSDEKIIVDQK